MPRRERRRVEIVTKRKTQNGADEKHIESEPAGATAPPSPSAELSPAAGPESAAPPQAGAQLESDGERFFYKGKPYIHAFQGREEIANQSERAGAERRGWYQSVDNQIIKLYEEEQRLGVVSQAWMAGVELPEAATFGVLDDNDQVKPMPPPAWLAPALCTRGHHPELQIAAGTRTSPFGSTDGTLVTQPGYDKMSRLILTPKRLVTMPISIDRDLALQYANEILDGIFGDFPLSQIGRAAVLALMLTIVMRAAFGCAPLFVVTGNAPGVGKGLLAQVCALIASGVSSFLVPFRGDPQEQEKTFLSAVMFGAAVILLDNVDQALGGGTIDSFITSEVARFRPLGASEMISVPTSTSTLVATGNGVTFLGDTNRRVLPIFLESPVEHPEQRSDFKIPDLLSTVKEYAGELNDRILWILEAYRLAGRPRSSATPWGSFEGWCHHVRDCVIWLGLPDPCAARAALVEMDPDRNWLEAILPVIEAADKAKGGLTAQEIARIPGSSHLFEDFVDRTGSVNAVGLGRRLKTFRGRNVGGRKLVPRTIKGYCRWSVRAVGEGV